MLPLTSVRMARSRPALTVPTLPRLVVVAIWASMSPAVAVTEPMGPLATMAPLMPLALVTAPMEPAGPVTSMRVLTMVLEAVKVVMAPETRKDEA